MAFHARAPIFQQIQPHHDSAAAPSGSNINDEIDAETAALIANLALDDIDNFVGSSADFLSPDSDEAIAYLLSQTEQIDQWLSSVTNAKSSDSALDTKTASLDAFITAEEAAVVEDQIASELLSRGEALPDSKSCQTRLEDPNSIIVNPALITVYV